jgi:hypothetical protein
MSFCRRRCQPRPARPRLARRCTSDHPVPVRGSGLVASRTLSVRDWTGGAPVTGLSQIVIDSRDPARLVRFWAALLGGEPVDRAHGWSHVDPPGFPRLAFQPVPEPKSTKNRLHLDITVDSVPTATTRATTLGATPVGPLITDDSGTFQVLHDPETNEFCLVHP